MRTPPSPVLVAIPPWVRPQEKWEPIRARELPPSDEMVDIVQAECHGVPTPMLFKRLDQLNLKLDWAQALDLKDDIRFCDRRIDAISKELLRRQNAAVTEARRWWPGVGGA